MQDFEACDDEAQNSVNAITTATRMERTSLAQKKHETEF